MCIRDRKSTKDGNHTPPKSKDFNQKKSISRNTKLTHYKTVICHEALYACECLGVFSAKKILKVRRRLLRKMYGPQQIKEFFVKFKSRRNEEIYKHFQMQK